MSITIYGIKNCETMNKARAWLDKHGVDYSFHDYKVAGIDHEQRLMLKPRQALRDLVKSPSGRD